MQKIQMYTDSSGHPFFYDIDLFLDEIKKYKNKEIECSFKIIGGEHSDEQRGYYFAVVNRLIWLGLVDAGFELTEAQAHIWNKSNSDELKEAVRSTDGKELLEVQIDFAKAPKEVISRFIDERIRFAATKLSIRIPPPPDPGHPFSRIKNNVLELRKYRRN